LIFYKASSSGLLHCRAQKRQNFSGQFVCRAQSQKYETINMRQRSTQNWRRYECLGMSAPSLLYYLAHEFIAPVKRKGLFSGEYVLFAEYLSHAQLLYETGAVLGCVYRDRLETFAELFSEPGRQAELANFLITGTVVADRLAALPDEPKNFYELFFKPEFMKKAHDFGLTQFSEMVNFPKLSQKVYMLKIPIKGAFEHIYDTALEGIQFGSQRPDLTENYFYISMMLKSGASRMKLVWKTACHLLKPYH